MSRVRGAGIFGDSFFIRCLGIEVFLIRFELLSNFGEMLCFSGLSFRVRDTG